MKTGLNTLLDATDEALDVFQINEKDLQIHLSPSYEENIGGRIDYAAHPYTEEFEDLDLLELGNDLPEGFEDIPIFFNYATFGGYTEEEFEQEYRHWTEKFNEEFPEINLNYVEGYEV